MPNDALLFFRLWLKSPLRIAALSPSSPPLARAMARHIDVTAAEPVLELGGGTGSITAALLDAGLPAERLYVLERAPELCAVLHRRFPGTTVLQGDADTLQRLLQRHGVKRLSAVVSSLPIIWLPLPVQEAIVAQAFAMMPPGGRFLQVTNQPASPLPAARLGLIGERVDYVWRNLPPSAVWSYLKPPQAAATRGRRAAAHPASVRS